MINVILAIVAMACAIFFAALAVLHSDDLGQMVLLGMLALMVFVGFIWAIVNPDVGTDMFNIFAGTEYLLGITDMFLFVLYCAAHSY
jgi:hypothetical protein